MNEITGTLSAYKAGILDAIGVWHCIPFFYESAIIRTRALRCLILNGLVFLGSILLLNTFILPFVHWMFVSTGNTAEAHVASTFTSYILSFSYNLLWLYPVYTISFILNTIWYQEIAVEAFKVHTKKPLPQPDFSYQGWVKMLADELYRIILFALFFVQVSLAVLVPYVGPTLYFLGLAWLYAFYCFDYKWYLTNLDLEKRLQYFEKRWAYFAGFGSPCTLATFFFPGFISAGIFALIFPLFVILAVRANPVHSGVTNDGLFVPTQLPIFAWSKSVTMTLLRRVDDRNGHRS